LISHKADKITEEILRNHGDVTLCADIFYVNGEKFFHTISRKIQFHTVAPIKTRGKTTILRETKAIRGLYEARGFNMSDIHADQEFACIQQEILPTNLNIAAADDHVHEIERSIQTVKEQVQCLFRGLPFQVVPRAIIRAMVENAVKGLNNFPVKNGISQTLSPRTIMTGRLSLDYSKLLIEFRAYTQVFEDNNATNTNKARTTVAIALNPTGNE